MNRGIRKIPKKKARGILNLAKWRDLELKILDEEIAQLQARRNKIYRGYNNKQLTVRYGVTDNTVFRIVNRLCWKDL